MNAIIVAGGKSSRYGDNKAIATIEGQTIIELITAKLKGVFNRVYIIGNIVDYSFLKGVELVNDICPGKGPLGGLYTGLIYSTSELNFVIGCDMPLVTIDYIKLLLSRNKGYDVLVARYRGYLEPLGGIYSQNCIKPIERALENNELKIKSFYSEVKVEVLEEYQIRKITNPEMVFFNFNTIEDLVLLKKEWDKTGTDTISSE